MDNTDSPHLLCTGSVPVDLLEEAGAKGVQMDCLSFIHTEEVPDNRESVLEAAQKSAIVLFTSIKAVNAVRNMLGGIQPAWKIFAIGRKTSEQAKKLFPLSELVDEASYGTELAQKIVSRFPSSSVVFFCGDISRKETQEVLTTNGIELKTVIVYKTFQTPHNTGINYQGVLFFSPSAVESYFAANSPATNQYFFAIGTTTEEAIKKFTNNKIITGAMPDKRLLVQTAIRFFTEKTSFRDHEYTTK